MDFNGFSTTGKKLRAVIDVHLVGSLMATSFRCCFSFNLKFSSLIKDVVKNETDLNP
jgi:hypothetical protein